MSGQLLTVGWVEPHAMIRVYTRTTSIQRYLADNQLKQLITYHRCTYCLLIAHSTGRNFFKNIPQLHK